MEGFMGQCRKRHASLLPTLGHVAPPKREVSGKCHLILVLEIKAETKTHVSTSCLCQCEIST